MSDEQLTNIRRALVWWNNLSQKERERRRFQTFVSAAQVQCLVEAFEVQQSNYEATKFQLATAEAKLASMKARAG